MGGEGFSRWASDVNRQNRQLLKGNQSGYSNFDKSYITDYIISRKPLIFKEATPEYMEELHRHRPIYSGDPLELRGVIWIPSARN